MIYITGDTHGRFLHRLSLSNFPEQKEMTKDDYVIILGDFGGVWCRDDKKSLFNDIDKEYDEAEKDLDELNNKSFTTLFIDGNHSNFDRLYKYPVKEWNGGKVHEIRPSILHLMRGEVFNLQGKKFFAFGGARSHDISDGIIDYDDPALYDLIYEKQRYGKTMFRIKGLSWWPEEMPNKEEMENGIENLEKNNWKVNYILTHSPSASTIAYLGNGLYSQDDLTRYLEYIRDKTEFDKWYSGHMHISKDLFDKETLLYGDIRRIV